MPLPAPSKFTTSRTRITAHLQAAAAQWGSSRSAFPAGGARLTAPTSALSQVEAWRHSTSKQSSKGWINPPSFVRARLYGKRTTQSQNRPEACTSSPEQRLSDVQLLSDVIQADGKTAGMWPGSSARTASPTRFRGGSL